MKNYFATNKEKIYRTFELIIVGFILFITNRKTWLCVLEVNKPLFYCEYGSWISEIIVLLLLFLIMLLLLYEKGQTLQFINAWRWNWLILLFLFLGLLSYLWSILPLGTTQRVLQLTFSTILAAYLGYKYSDRSLLDILFWFFVVVTIASYLLVAVLPGAAIMSTYPHEGAWRGAFSHRNYLGSLAAFGNALAVLTFVVAKNDRIRKIVAILLFLGTLVLIILSRSATGLVLMVFLNIIFVIAMGWIFIWNKLKPIFKSGIILSIIAMIILMVLNSGKLFSLIGRESTLTGRIPLWQYLINVVSNHNIVIGFGLGTIWNFLSFKEQAAADLGWEFQVVNGHNGYMDTLLYLGIVGLVLLIMISIQALVQTIARINKQKTIISIFPFLVVMYVLITNITISFFFEFETFHWVLLVSMLFLTNKDWKPDKPLET